MKYLMIFEEFKKKKKLNPKLTFKEVDNDDEIENSNTPDTLSEEERQALDELDIRYNIGTDITYINKNDARYRCM